MAEAARATKEDLPWHDVDTEYTRSVVGQDTNGSPNLRRVIERAKECERLYDEIEPILVDFSARKRFNQAHVRAFRSRSGLWEKHPDEWPGLAEVMLTCGSAMTVPSRAASFARATRAVLSDRAVALTRHWREEPWFYSAFSVVEDLGRSLLVIEEMESGERFTLYSPGTSTMLHDGTLRFLALLFTNGECYQVCGGALPLGGFSAADLRFFADAVEFDTLVRRLGADRAVGHAKKRTRPLQEVVARNPVEFMSLYAFSATPAMVFRGTRMEFAVGWAQTEAPVDVEACTAALEDDEQVPDTRLVTGAVEISFPDRLPPEAGAVIVAGNRVIVSAFTISRYTEIVRALSGLVSMPDEPTASCSMEMYLAAKSILEHPDPSSLHPSLESEKHEPEPEESGMDSGGLDTANRVMNRIVEAHNEGEEVDPQSIATELDVPVEMVHDLQESLSEVFGRLDQNMPVSDRFGLPPRAMQELTSQAIPKSDRYLRLREPGEVSPIPSELCETSWLYKAVRWLAETIATEGAVSLTAAGYLPTRFVRDAYERRDIPTAFDYEKVERNTDLAESIRPKKEMDWPQLGLVRSMAEHIGLIVVEGSKLRAAGSALLASPEDLYRSLLLAGLRSFDWGEFDGIVSTPIVSRANGFLLYAARKLSGPASDSKWVPSDELVEVFYRAFPNTRPPEREEPTYLWPVSNAVSYRFMRRFACSLGLFETDRADIKRLFRTARLFDTLFEFGG